MTCSTALALGDTSTIEVAGNSRPLGRAMNPKALDVVSQKQECRDVYIAALMHLRIER